MNPKSKVSAPPVTVEDDDDLDELDDVLEQFSKPAPVPTQPTKVPPPATAPQPAATVPGLPEEDAAFTDDFAAELAAGMESFMKELTGGAFADGASGPADEEAFRKAFESMLVSDLDGAPTAAPALPKGTAPAAASSGPSPQPDADFQKTIRETVERLKTSDDTLKENAASSSDPLNQLLAQLGDLGDLGDLGGEGGEDVQGMLESMMSQLMSKELLYEPMKELNEKYPEYLASNSSKLPAADVERYKKQHVLIVKIMKEFDDPSYADDNPEKSALILKLMNEMQALGSPPTEIMGDLPEGFQLGPDGMPSLDGPDGCVIS